MNIINMVIIWFYIFYLWWKCLIYGIIFFLRNICTFRSQNKLFLDIINTEIKRKTTSLYYILYILGKTTQSEPTQREWVFGTKPPSAKTWLVQNHLDSVKRTQISFLCKINNFYASLSLWVLFVPARHIYLHSSKINCQTINYMFLYLHINRFHRVDILIFQDLQNFT